MDISSLLSWEKGVAISAADMPPAAATDAPAAAIRTIAQKDASGGVGGQGVELEEGGGEVRMMWIDVHDDCRIGRRKSSSSSSRRRSAIAAGIAAVTIVSKLPSRPHAVVQGRMGGDSRGAAAGGAKPRSSERRRDIPMHRSACSGPYWGLMLTTGLR